MSWRIVAVCALLAIGAAGAETLVDPTRPAGWKPPESRPVKLPGLKVGSVVYSSSHRFAVVNGRRVQEGDQVAGARVVRIRPGQVQFVYRGIRFWRQGATVAEVKKTVK
ncbi:MAG: hypothetical protein D6758_13145 [Gammaproteobacteria bacterium]|nr:MAG: hypothetical protein D6758_13145 [Gammaproteobacteria bacterium]